MFPYMHTLYIVIMRRILPLYYCFLSFLHKPRLLKSLSQSLSGFQYDLLIHVCNVLLATFYSLFDSNVLTSAWNRRAKNKNKRKKGLEGIKRRENGRKEAGRLP
jgi:hypothetical protein